MLADGLDFLFHVEYAFLNVYLGTILSCDGIIISYEVLTSLAY